jgi:hypothetical protein
MEKLLGETVQVVAIRENKCLKIRGSNTKFDYKKWISHYSSRKKDGLPAGNGDKFPRL